MIWRRRAIALTVGLILLLAGQAVAQSLEFPTSLHATRAGKDHWYAAENGGFEAFTGVPIEQLGCAECHGPTDADGNAYVDYEPSCLDCHPSDGSPVSESQCYGCHGRQKTEVFQLGYSDVHRDAGFTCWSCHYTGDLHGDGNAYDSMLEPNAISANCEQCHQREVTGSSHAQYDPHGGKVHCTACHAQTVITCYNCHFESQIESHVKRAKQPLHDFVILANREEDGKVYPMTFQSVTYQGQSFAAFGPFTSHTITLQGRVCTACHANMGGNVDAITQYNDTGEIKFAEWDDTAKTLSAMTGIIPMPADYQTSWKMDFIQYDGATSDPAGPSSNWSSIGKDTWDGHQMLYASPLTADQMAKLGMNGPTADPFETSLHATRAGKDFWYSAQNGGFEAMTNVPIEQLGCVECHGPTDADGNAYVDYEPSCADCHSSAGFLPVDQSQCYSCHGRQKTEAMALGYTDVHRDSGMQCWDCHTHTDLHGDGNAYQSMLEPNAISVDCEDCHTTPSAAHAGYDPHAGKLHCTSCHAQTVISCYNCHFESQVESHVKRAKQPLHDFVILANRQEDGKVYPMTFQSLTYQGQSFAAFGPFTSHTITLQGRTCTECHVNMGGTVDAIDEYNATGEIKFAAWDDVAKTLTAKSGIVPMPADYQTSWKMDFIQYDGATSDPAGPSSNWSSIGKDTWDGHQMFFATPLTQDQMDKLGMTGPSTDPFETSLHKTRAGKDYWYSADNGGFEQFTNVPIEQLGCVECHGPTDADGNAYVDYEPSCLDCHPSADFMNVSQNQCYSCHGRQKTEVFQLGYTDVHRDAGMVCWDCHTNTDLHGDGTPYQSMLEPNAISVDCEDCHTTPSAAHAGYDPHSGKLHCTTCHAQTVISCYNCHFESQVESHVKRAKQPLHDFVILANRQEDGKVYPMTFQSLTYQGQSFAAFGPFTSHTITLQGRTCTECHVNMGGTVDAIDEYNATGMIKFAEWDDVAKTLTAKSGIVPMPADYETSWKMDFIKYDGATSDPAGPSSNWSSIGKDTWDGHQMFFASPLTEEQMTKIGMQAPPVPAMLAMFDARPVSGTVQLTWRINGSVSGDFRVTASADGRSWEVDVQVTPDGFAATDDVSTMTAGGTVLYTLHYRPQGGAWGELDSKSLDLPEIPNTAVLNNVYPNPFNPMTKVSFTLTGNQQVRIAVYDIKGALVQTLTDQVYGPGTHDLTWRGTDSSGQAVSAGTYLLHMRTDTTMSSRKLSLVR